MPDPLEPERCAHLLRALAAPERLRILRFLSDGPKNVSEIADALDIRCVNLSHHLSVLRNAGLVCDEKQGRFVLYSISPDVWCPPDGEGALASLDLGCCRIELPVDLPS
jgi:DNA-binding transcriptional ArsR family regulator